MDMPDEEIPPMQEPPMNNEPGSDAMDEPQMDEPEGVGGENSEIEKIFNSLDTEKQAQLVKYGKSLMPDDGLEDEPEGDNMVEEITNNILADKEEERNRDDKKVRNKKIDSSNPFITKSFNTKK